MADRRSGDSKLVIRNGKIVPESATPRERLKRIADIIEVADQRALAADGPVSHVRDELSDAEWREIYVLAKGQSHAD